MREARGEKWEGGGERVVVKEGKDVVYRREREKVKGKRRVERGKTGTGLWNAGGKAYVIEGKGKDERGNEGNREGKRGDERGNEGNGEG